jgi:succinate dehydrogenase / fumarate reductase flavoprotein subunit
MKLAEEGVHVDLFSLGPALQSSSALAQGGINACNDIARQQGYSEWTHFEETIIGGDFLADQPPVHEMCNWAPRIVDLLDRMGVPFNRTIEGHRDLRLMPGSLFKRTYFCGASTGQHILQAFDEQVRRYEAGALIHRHEYFEFLWPVIHDPAGKPACVGIVAQDLRSMKISAFRGDAVVIATGNYSTLFARSTGSLSSNGAAISRCYQAGAKLANPEFIQFHPTTLHGEDKSRLISDAVRGEGGRLWVPAIKEDGRWKPNPNSARSASAIPENERFYFLEERFPKYANLVPRDIATREILHICRQGFGIAGGEQVYLDFPRKAAGNLQSILETYRRFGGADPLEESMKVGPAVHCGIGGLWTNFTKDEKTGGLRAGDPANLSTNIPGLYAIGEANFAHHGASRLGGNGLLSRIFDGLFSAPCIKNYCADAAPIASSDVPQGSYDAIVKEETDNAAALLARDGNENPYPLRHAIAGVMSQTCGAFRENDSLAHALVSCYEWKERCRSIKVSDNPTWANQTIPFARATRDVIALSEAILKAALLRNESRGTHFKTRHPERDDARFLKATIAIFDPHANAPSIEYEPVNTSLIAPKARKYEE